MVFEKNKFLLFCLLILQGFSSFSAETCRIIYFADKYSLEKSTEIYEIILPQLQEVYGNKIELLRLDLEIPENFETLMAFESEYNVPSGDMPEFFTSFGAVRRTDNIRKKLPELVESELASGKSGAYHVFFEKYFASGKTEKCSTGILPVYKNNQNPLKIYYFHKPGCRTCNRLEISLDYFSKRYPELLKIFRCNINDAKSKVVNEALCIKYSVPYRLHLATPAVFFGKECLIGEKSFKNINITDKIVSAIKTSDRFATPDFSMDELISAERSINSRYDKINLAAILSAGLIDGINPCAFVTIVFLLSYLALLEYGKKEIILVGLSFTITVFITYLLIGLGFLKFAQYLQSISGLNKYVYYSGALIAGFVGIMNLADYCKMKKGSLQGMNLKLDDRIRTKINTVIRENIKLRNYVIGAGVIGFLVSILELTCTGQTYLPTVMFIVNTQGIQMKSLMMLLFYNLAFIVPLIIVFMLFSIGVTDRNLSAWLRNHAAKIKLATGIVFIGMAVLLVII